MKVCKTCRIEKPENDFYKSGKYLNSECKVCTKNRSKVHYIKNIEHKKEYIKEYYQKNAEQIKERKKEWGNRNPEKLKKYYLKGNIKNRAKRTIWQKENRHKYEYKYAEANRIRSRKHSVKNVKKLNDRYILSVLQKLGFDRQQAKQYPDLIKIKRLSMITKRTIKHLTPNTKQ